MVVRTAPTALQLTLQQTGTRLDMSPRTTVPSHTSAHSPQLTELRHTQAHPQAHPQKSAVKKMPKKEGGRSLEVALCGAGAGGRGFVSIMTP